MSKVLLAIIIAAIGTLIGALFVFAAFTLQAASFRLRVRESPQ
jgi:hypothetical protein